jgi:N-acetylglucosamine-6-phosphate deacetylase
MSAPLHAVAGGRIFDGTNVHMDMAVAIEGERIAGLIARADLPQGIPRYELPEGAWLAPGFIDIQVNGGGDVLFNDQPTPEGVRAIAAAHRKLGTTALLPTLISDTAEKMAAALAAIDAVAATEPSVLGVHLEGPYLSPQKAGIHDRRFFRAPTSDDVAKITARKDVTLVTLAPEHVPGEFIENLAAAGVRIALGHSMATYAQTRAAMERGLKGFTHLFNAMRPLDAREPGPIAAALESPQAWYGLIVDGVHVAPAMLRLAVRGAGKPILVSDAMSPVGGTRAAFTINGDAIFVRNGRCTRSDGTLAGAYLDMATAVRNCVRLLDVSLADALRFASVHPAEFLGLGNSVGKIAPGFRADMVALDGETLAVIETWVAGTAVHAAPPRLGP